MNVSSSNAGLANMVLSGKNANSERIAVIVVLHLNSQGMGSAKYEMNGNMISS